jgi:predicted DNA-binding transcriptional regulator
MAKAAAKKTTVKKTPATKTAGKPAKSDSDPKIKYADKSAGQPDLLPIFETIVKLMEPYAKGSVEKIGGQGGQVSLISKKPSEINGKKVDEVWLSGALVQKGYVGFYYMPVYVAPDEIKPELKPELLKTLKGKSCFHIKKLDNELTKQIKEAIDKGYKLYKQKGWIS